MRNSKDYIPYEFEKEQEREKRKAWQSEHPDPRKSYKISYTVHGTPLSEVKTNYAHNDTEALELFKNECNKVGWFPRNVLIVEI